MKLGVTIYLLVCAFAWAQPGGWAPGASPLTTRFAADVSPATVLPEYPRPQLERADWQNLNGVWAFAVTGLDAPPPPVFDRQILVPFPVESALSGVTERVDGKRVWYQRSFEVPEAWRKGRLLLHFGAVDWDTTVWLNGTELGRHRGGYDPFSFDVTEALEPGARQTLRVSVADPTDAGPQPRGKQVREPGGIWYTPTTGIWQTVWLEPVPETYIASLTLTPDLAARVLRLKVDAPAGEVTVVATADGEPVGEVQGQAGDTLELSVPNARLWSPADPFLYDLEVSLRNGGEVDRVSSYFGMREIGLGKDEAGVTRLLLNGRPLFQYGLLDQGFWPEGLYTAPTDEALRFDLELTKQLGFNLVRKHVKVEPARWYAWADRLGLLVWQDMPNGDAHVANGNGEIDRSEASAEQFELELKRMVDSLHNHPSVVMWVLFNEGWGQYDTARLTDWLQAYDPSRLVNSASGWNDTGTGDVLDIHSYPGPAAPPADEERALVLGEFGGLGLALPGLTWQDEANWGYQEYGDRVALMDAYAEQVVQLRRLSVERGLSAAVYTQTTDVETEVNGALTYDRALAKLEPGQTRWTNRILYRPLPSVTALSPTSETESVSWRYTFDEPAGDWTAPTFDDSGWLEGEGGFGEWTAKGGTTRTEWAERGIWLRRTFSLDSLPLNPLLRLHHDEDIEVYVNGEIIKKLPYYTFDYIDVPVEDATVFATGRNVLGVHCKRVGPGAYCDAGIYDTTERLAD